MTAYSTSGKGNKQRDNKIDGDKRKQETGKKRREKSVVYVPGQCVPLGNNLCITPSGSIGINVGGVVISTDD